MDWKEQEWRYEPSNTRHFIASCWENSEHGEEERHDDTRVDHGKFGLSCAIKYKGADKTHCSKSTHEEPKERLHCFALFSYAVLTPGTFGPSFSVHHVFNSTKKGDCATNDVPYFRLKDFFCIQDYHVLT